MMAADNDHTKVVEMLLDRNANIEAVNKVGQNVSIACTALRSIPMIIMIIVIMIILNIAITFTVIVVIIVIIIIICFSYRQYYNIILSIISLYSYSINYQDIFYYAVVVQLFVIRCILIVIIIIILSVSGVIQYLTILSIISDMKQYH